MAARHLRAFVPVAQPSSPSDSIVRQWLDKLRPARYFSGMQHQGKVARFVGYTFLGAVYPFYAGAVLLVTPLIALLWIAFAPMRKRQAQIDPEGYAESQKKQI